MTIGDGILGAFAAAIIGWFANSVTKVGKTEFKEIVKRIDAVEKDLVGRMTRAEFEQAFSKVEGLVREFRIETRAEFKELKSELKTKT
jgi:hypothetical protein